MTRTITPGQINLLRTIAAERDITNEHNARLEARIEAGLPMSLMNETMAWLKKHELRANAVTSAPAQERKDSVTIEEPGFYLYENEAFRVKRTRDGQRFYAERATASGWDYEGAKGIVYRLEPSMLMTPMEIAATGAVKGFCIICSDGLGDPTSKRIGLGTSCGPKTLGKDAYREARKYWIANDPECAAHDAELKASAKARREAKKAQEVAEAAA